MLLQQVLLGLGALSLLASAQTTYPLPRKVAPGLPDDGIKLGPIAVGFLPDWENEGPLAVNAALGASVSIIGDYVNPSPRDYSFNQIDWHLPELRRATRGVKSVYCPAVLYGDDLSSWTSEMSNNLAQKVKMVNDAGVVVWLRLLFEMNGDWMPYGLQHDDFNRVWREVTTAVRAATNETYMLWAPNLWTGSVSDPSQGYVPFFPGEEYVDIAGLSYYSFGDDKTYNQPPAANEFTRNFKPFYDLMNPASSNANLLSLTQGIPVVIAETSAPYYYALDSSSPYFSQTPDTDIARPLPNLTDFTPSMASPPHAHSDDELFIKATWWVQLTQNTTALAFPNYVAASIFNHFKRGGETDVLADFRAVGGNETVEQWFRGDMGNQTAFERGYTSGVGRGAGASALAVVVAVATMAGCLL